MHSSHKRLSSMSQSCGRNLGAIILGLNDALVELTGSLAGFTMALNNNQLIALAGLTMGVAATLSMGASEYLASSAETPGRRACESALYTGGAYLVTTALLLLPYIFLHGTWLALGLCLFTAGIIIMIFTWLEARLRSISFIRKCLQMLAISFGVAAISFCISWAASALWGIKSL